MTSTVSFKDKLKQIFSVILWDLKGCKDSLMVYTIMASAATPLALIVLGASFEFASIKRYKKNLIAVIFARLIIVPAIRYLWFL
jgi:predicted permease